MSLLYRSRNLVEQSLDMLKNDLELLPLNVKTTGVPVRTPVCLAPDCLLVRMHILKQLQTKGLVKKCSLERVFLVLDNIRWLVLTGGKELITEIGKKQRTILDAFTILPEVKNYVRT